MECERCHAMMLEETFEDIRADSWTIDFHGWRCPGCGNVLDPVILENRSAASRVMGAGARRRHNAQAL